MLKDSLKVLAGMASILLGGWMLYFAPIESDADFAGIRMLIGFLVFTAGLVLLLMASVQATRISGDSFLRKWTYRRRFGKLAFIRNCVLGACGFLAVLWLTLLASHEAHASLSETLWNYVIISALGIGVACLLGSHTWRVNEKRYKDGLADHRSRKEFWPGS